MKIVVLDGYTENPGDLSWSALEQLGELVVYDRTSYEESDLVAERIGDADVAIMNKTPISKATMDQCPNLKLIAVLATGYNVVDIAYAKEKGIPVCNVPNYGGYSVSQFAIALMLEACLHIGHHDRTVHEGKWQNGEEWCYWDYPLIEVAGKTYGLLGCGRIGIHTAEAANRLAEALREKGVETVAMDLARCDMAEAVAQAFRFSKLVLATPTYNADVFPFMKEFIHHLTERNYQNRTVAFIENGSWAPMAAKVMTKMLEGSKNLTYAATTVTVRGALNASSEAQLAALADELSR